MIIKSDMTKFISLFKSEPDPIPEKQYMNFRSDSFIPKIQKKIRINMNIFEIRNQKICIIINIISTWHRTRDLEYQREMNFNVTHAAIPPLYIYITNVLIINPNNTQLTRFIEIWVKAQYN